MVPEVRQRPRLRDQWNRVVDRLLEEPRLSAALACLGVSVTLVLTFGMGAEGLGSRGLQDAAVADAVLRGESIPAVGGGILSAILLATGFSLAGTGAVWVKVVAFTLHGLALAALFMLTRDYAAASLPATRGRRIGPERAFPKNAAGWLVVALFAANPLVMLGVAAGASDALAILAFGAFCVVGLRAVARGAGTLFALAGVFAAFAVLARPGMLIAVAGASFAIVLFTPADRRVRAALGVATPLAVILTPWVIWNGARLESAWLPALLGAPGLVNEVTSNDFAAALVIHAILGAGALVALMLFAPHRFYASLRRAFIARDAPSAILWVSALAVLAASAFEGARSALDVSESLVLILPAVPLLLWLALREAYLEPAPRAITLDVPENAFDDPLPPWIEWPAWTRRPVPRRETDEPVAD